MCLKRKHPLIVLFMSSGQTWTTGELMRLTLSHVVCESLIFPLFFTDMKFNSRQKYILNLSLGITSGDLFTFSEC